MQLEKYRQGSTSIVNPSSPLAFLAMCIYHDDYTFKKVLKYNHPMLGLTWSHHPYWNFFQWPLMSCLFLNKQRLFKHAEIHIRFYSRYLKTYLKKYIRKFNLSVWGLLFQLPSLYMNVIYNMPNKWLGIQPLLKYLINSDNRESTTTKAAPVL